MLGELKQQNPRPTSVTVAKADSRLKLYRFASAGTENVPRALQERVTALPQPPHTQQQQQLSSNSTWDRRGRAEGNLSVLGSAQAAAE